MISIITITALVVAVWGFWWRAERFEDEISRLRATITTAARAGCRCDTEDEWDEGPCGSCICQNAIGKETREA